MKIKSKDCIYKGIYISILIVFLAILKIDIAFAIKVYRSPESLFSSGDYKISILNKNKKRSIEVRWLQIKKSKLIGWIKSNDIISYKNLTKKALVNKKTPIYDSYENKKIIGYLKENENIKVVFLENNLALIQRKKENRPSLGWIDINDFIDNPYDWGYILLNKDTFLQKEPDFTSSLILRLKKYQKLELLDFVKDKTNNQWVKVKKGNKKGYLLFQDTINKTHFASSIKWKNKWYQNKKDFSQKKINPKSLQAIKIDKEKAIIKNSQVNIRKEPNNIVTPFSLIYEGKIVRIMNYEIKHWNLSKVKKSFVWWTQKEEIKASNSLIKTIDFQKLLKKQIYSIKKSINEPYFYVASAYGIYLSFNGKDWQKLKKFKNKNYPIFISEENEIFVGPYYSKDYGKNFISYVDYEKVLNKIQNQYQKIPAKLEILKISSYKDQTLMLSFDLGWIKVNLPYSFDFKNLGFSSLSRNTL